MAWRNFSFCTSYSCAFSLRSRSEWMMWSSLFLSYRARGTHLRLLGAFSILSWFLILFKLRTLTIPLEEGLRSEIFIGCPQCRCLRCWDFLLCLVVTLAENGRIDSCFMAAYITDGVLVFCLHELSLDGWGSILSAVRLILFLFGWDLLWCRWNESELAFCFGLFTMHFSWQFIVLVLFIGSSLPLIYSFSKCEIENYHF